MTQGPAKNDGGAQRSQGELARLRKLGELMKEFDLVELELEPEGGVKLRRREEKSSAAPMTWIPTVPVSTADRAANPADAAAPPSSSASPSNSAPPPAPREGLVEMTSPIVGTFYRASAPDKEPFVEKGARVKAETVVCIIEAMKVMNEIRAEMSGEIVEVLARNGEAVEFNQPLFLIRPE
jgi:acetyl-CoA carboxylase biotin carboxyl carrier protein